MLLYIVRHGETDLNSKGCVQGHIDEPLNANGIALTEITGEGLADVKFDYYITSPLSRSVTTAEIIFQKSHHPTPSGEADERIMEIDWGSWDAHCCLGENYNMPCPREVAEGLYADPFHFEGAPDGESLLDVCNRTADFWQDLIRREDLQDKTVLVSTHALASRALLRNVYDDKADFWHGRVPYNCCVNIVEVKNGKSTLLEEDKIFYERGRSINPYDKILQNV